MAQKALSPRERRDLAEYEGIIEEGVATFFAVGCALAFIHGKKLYRETHATWEAYCRERWSFSRQYAERLIVAAEVCSDLRTGGQTATGGCVSLPGSARIAGALAGLDTADRRRDVWDQAVALAAPAVPTADEVERLTARALASLSPAQQLQILQEEEATARAAAAPLEKPGEEAARLARTLKHLRKAGNAATHLPEKYRIGRELLAAAQAEFESPLAGAARGIS